MSEVIPFPRVRRLAPAGQRVMTVGVGTALVATSGIPTGIVCVDDDMSLRYVPAWELGVRSEVADLWVAVRLPSAPHRRVIFETLAGDVVEQDEDDRLWMNGERLDDGAPVAIGGAADEREGPLRIGDPAAVLVASRDPLSFRFAVHVTPPILWIFEPPRLIARAPVLRGWLRAAHLLWLEQQGAA